MINPDWWLWMLMFMLLVPAVGYFWGHRGWGAPYPRVIQRRRAKRAAAEIGSGAGSSAFNHESWGWGGDVVWGIILCGLGWAFIAVWRH